MDVITVLNVSCMMLHGCDSDTECMMLYECDNGTECIMYGVVSM